MNHSSANEIQRIDVTENQIVLPWIISAFPEVQSSVVRRRANVESSSLGNWPVVDAWIVVDRRLSASSSTDVADRVVRVRDASSLDVHNEEQSMLRWRKRQNGFSRNRFHAKRFTERHVMLLTSLEGFRSVDVDNQDEASMIRDRWHKFEVRWMQRARRCRRWHHDYVDLSEQREKEQMRSLLDCVYDWSEPGRIYCYWSNQRSVYDDGGYPAFFLSFPATR